MPVRSLKQSVWRWPAPEQVLNDVKAWGQQQQRRAPGLQRLQQWPLAELPLSCDALVLTPAELEQRLNDGSRMAMELRRDLL